jgi:flavodoxin
MAETDSNHVQLVVASYHHHNTKSVAGAMAAVLQATIIAPNDADPATLAAADLIGFGSGIYHAKHHQALLALAERLPEARGQRAFLFSTSGVYSKKKLLKDHQTLRDLLTAKGYVIVDEFGCKGHDSYSFLKFIGGLNKGRPNAADLERARGFARALANSPRSDG